VGRTGGEQHHHEKRERVVEHGRWRVVAFRVGALRHIALTLVGASFFVQSSKSDAPVQLFGWEGLHLTGSRLPYARRSLARPSARTNTQADERQQSRGEVTIKAPPALPSPRRVRAGGGSEPNYRRKRFFRTNHMFSLRSVRRRV
jgi:hypothetical protein